MRADITLIGGVGIDLGGEEVYMKTPYGKVKAEEVALAGREVLFIPRHGEDHLPPHMVSYRAILCAAKKSGARRVISTNTVGTMSWHQVGSFVVPHDFVEFTRSRPATFFEHRAVHVDMTDPYCPQLRAALKEGVKATGMEPHDGIYVCTEGPHLETPAQIGMIRNFGDVVGMTGYPEVVLARELGLCYATICVVTNVAAGMKKDALTITEVLDQMAESIDRLRDIISHALPKIPEVRSCRCGEALDEAML